MQSVATGTALPAAFGSRQPRASIPRAPKYSITYITPPLSTSAEPLRLLPLPLPRSARHERPQQLQPVLPVTPPLDLYKKRKLEQLQAIKQARTLTLAAAAATASAASSSASLSSPLNVNADEKHPPSSLLSSSRPCSPPVSAPPSPATVRRRLEQRQKQLDIGKATAAYSTYLLHVPLSARLESRRQAGHPLTPRKAQSCSKRAWDGQVRKWRRQLHEWDEGGRMWKEVVEGRGGEGAAQPQQQDQRGRSRHRGADNDEAEEEDEEEAEGGEGRAAGEGSESSGAATAETAGSPSAVYASEEAEEDEDGEEAAGDDDLMRESILRMAVELTD